MQTWRGWAEDWPWLSAPGYCECGGSPLKSGWRCSLQGASCQARWHPWCCHWWKVQDRSWRAEWEVLQSLWNKQSQQNHYTFRDESWAKVKTPTPLIILLTNIYRKNTAWTKPIQEAAHQLQSLSIFQENSTALCTFNRFRWKWSDPHSGNKDTPTVITLLLAINRAFITVLAINEYA